MVKDFGVIVTCSKSDFLFAKGCCASIRYYLGNTPICLLVDGDFDYKSLAKLYNAKVITKKDITNKDLQDRSFGWGVTKMNAFWFSPFEYFLLLDADTCIWGNILKDINFKKNDVIVAGSGNLCSDDTINKFFFDIHLIKTLFPDFNFRNFPYYCTGVTFAKRGIFSIEDYIDILNLRDKYPNIFKYGEMGFLNFMIFKGQQEGKIKVGISDIQYIVPDYEISQMVESFPVEENAVNIANPTVLHFCGGAKPVIHNNFGYYTKPMTFFRKKYLIDNKVSPVIADLILYLEDMVWKAKRMPSDYKGRIKRNFKRLSSKISFD
ncbi:hypothetical protein AAE02nite_08810 [Adhaeribacter aerolatus]|uniref:Glycosyl transferase n=2 Tax=Adhaeribacter aerolatus TaxID=670289 RepID=A0A512AUF8_9BACT|nr:hypothetical protein AAE02nite_08810 [Adhaeribacter aerolatus]